MKSPTYASHLIVYLQTPLTYFTNNCNQHANTRKAFCWLHTVIISRETAVKVIALKALPFSGINMPLKTRKTNYEEITTFKENKSCFKWGGLYLFDRSITSDADSLLFKSFSLHVRKQECKSRSCICSNTLKIVTTRIKSLLCSLPTRVPISANMSNSIYSNF